MIASRLCCPLVAALALACAACDEDPGKGKSQAQVGSAQPVASVDAAAFGTWKIAPDSKLAFVGANVTTKHNGGFKKLVGGINLADGKAAGGAVVVEIEMSSVFTDDEELTTHLKSGDFFDAATHPNASFVSTNVVAGGSDGATHTVTGNLTLRGETRSISFPATIDVGADTVTVKAEFAINRMDFKVSYKGAADDLIRESVAIALSLTARK